jgi:shikimate dehydrogenase
MAREIGGPIVVVDWADRAEAVDGVGLLVNTTNLGMIGAPVLSMPLTKLPTGAVVTDIVYTPLMTPLLVSARERGNVVVDGLGMLLHQARPGFAAWYGQEPEVTSALRAHVLGE